MTITGAKDAVDDENQPRISQVLRFKVNRCFFCFLSLFWSPTKSLAVVGPLVVVGLVPVVKLQPRQNLPGQIGSALDEKFPCRLTTLKQIST